MYSFILWSTSTCLCPRPSSLSSGYNLETCVESFLGSSADAPSRGSICLSQQVPLLFRSVNCCRCPLWLTVVPSCGLTHSLLSLSWQNARLSSQVRMKCSLSFWCVRYQSRLQFSTTSLIQVREKKWIVTDLMFPHAGSSKERLTDGPLVDKLQQ